MLAATTFSMPALSRCGPTSPARHSTAEAKGRRTHTQQTKRFMDNLLGVTVHRAAVGQAGRTRSPASNGRTAITAPPSPALSSAARLFFPSSLFPAQALGGNDLRLP